MDESCKTCIYFHKYKKFTDDGWEYSSCCTYFIQIETVRGNVPEYDVWVQDADENGICECYQYWNLQMLSAD